MAEAKTPARRRYPAEEARQRILEAARLRLMAAGPEGLRLQEIAADLGISHPAILHHFGSREGLLQALARHSAERLRVEIAARIEAGGADLDELLALTREMLGQGQARLLAWLALSGRMDGAEEGATLLRELVLVAHRARCRHADSEGQARPSEADTTHVVLLSALALLGDALAGDMLRASAGVGGPGSGEQFRSWLAGLLERHLVETPETTG